MERGECKQQKLEIIQVGSTWLVKAKWMDGPFIGAYTAKTFTHNIPLPVIAQCTASIEGGYPSPCSNTAAVSGDQSGIQ